MAALKMHMKNKICKLKKKECLELRPLWEEVFFEDSVEYTDFYFREKAGRNTAFILRGDEGKAIAMLHLSPYDLELRLGNAFACIRANYIVGVATLKEHRHKGYMDALLRASFEEMYQARQPFAFLMPASPRIYEPYQFVYIYDKKEFRVNPALIKRKELAAASEPSVKWEAAVMKEKEIPEIVHYVNRYLKDNYDVFIRRDEEYYRTLVKELKAQNGAFYLIRERSRDTREGALKGYFLYTEEEGKGDVQEALSFQRNENIVGRNGIVKETGTKPIIMARIIHVQTMLSLLRIRTEAGEDEEGIVLNISITDSLLPDNSGIWHCRIGKDNASAVKNAKTDADCAITIECLASWVFGYKEAEECFTFPEGICKEDLVCRIKRIKTLPKVLINEIT